MSIILNIDTSANGGMVSISSNGETLGHLHNADQYDHASFLQPAIKKLFNDLDMSLHKIDAVSVVNGPGSYTGLRVGLSSAKGICFALNKPLITINNLAIMAKAMQKTFLPSDSPALLCPMIDARRMEVFTAIYDHDLSELLKPCAMVINEKSLEEFLRKNKIVFFGNGASKVELIIKHTNASFLPEPNTINSIAEIANVMYQDNTFADLAYCEPFYLKEFFNG